jgi:hypothetical protein
VNEHEKETAFLRQCVSYEEGPASRQLHARIAQIQRDDRCLQRAIWLMGVLAAVAVFCFGYLAVFSDDFPAHVSLFAGQFATRVISAVGIGSVISLLAFAGLRLKSRRELNTRRDECRELVTNLLVRRLGQVGAASHNGHLKESEVHVPRGNLDLPVKDGANLPPARFL